MGQAQAHEGGPAWVPDEDATNCGLCESAFSAMKRRHHCRRCGGCICGACSASKITIAHLYGDAPVRVCNLCFTLGTRENAFQNEMLPLLTSGAVMRLRRRARDPAPSFVTYVPERQVISIADPQLNQNMRGGSDKTVAVRDISTVSRDDEDGLRIDAADGTTRLICNSGEERDAWLEALQELVWFTSATRGTSNGVSLPANRQRGGGGGGGGRGGSRGDEDDCITTTSTATSNRVTLRPAGNESDVFVDDNGEEWVDERSALRREREAKLAAIKEKYGYTS